MTNNDIEQKYGKHTVLVEAFITHLESGNVDWDDAYRAAGAVGGTAWGTARAAAWDAARVAAVAAWDAWDAATYAAYEIIGHELLAERGKPLVFLPMFGLDIEQVKEMASEQIAESANCPNCEATKQELNDFRQEVSDIVSAYVHATSDDDWEKLKTLIIPTPKPDPLVEAMKKAGWADAVIASCAPSLSAALEARGLEIREKNDGQ